MSNVEGSKNNSSENVTGIKFPQLKGVSMKEFTKFFEAYDDYLKNVEIYNVDKSRNEQRKPLPMVGCIDLDIKKSLCKYELKVNLDDLTEEILKDYYERKRESYPGESRRNVADVIKKELKYDLSIQDVSGRVLQFFQKLDMIIRDHCLEHCLR